MSLSTTQKQLEEFFLFSPIWEDILEELEVWLNEVHMQLENNGGELSSRTLDRLGGNAEAIRHLMDVEKVLMANYELEMKKSYKGENNDA